MPETIQPEQPAPNVSPSERIKINRRDFGLSLAASAFVGAAALETGKRITIYFKEFFQEKPNAKTAREVCNIVKMPEKIIGDYMFNVYQFGGEMHYLIDNKELIIKKDADSNKVSVEVYQNTQQQPKEEHKKGPKEQLS